MAIAEIGKTLSRLKLRGKTKVEPGKWSVRWQFKDIARDFEGFHTDIEKMAAVNWRLNLTGNAFALKADLDFLNRAKVQLEFNVSGRTGIRETLSFEFIEPGALRFQRSTIDNEVSIKHVLLTEYTGGTSEYITQTGKGCWGVFTSGSVQAGAWHFRSDSDAVSSDSIKREKPFPVMTGKERALFEIRMEKHESEDVPLFWLVVNPKIFNYLQNNMAHGKFIHLHVTPPIDIK